MEALIALFEAIAQEEGWQPGEQLRAHQDALCLLRRVHVDGTLAGGMQVTVAGWGKDSLPFQAVWPDADASAPCRTAHVPILAIRPEFRGPLRLFWPLCVELWRFCTVQWPRAHRD